MHHRVLYANYLPYSKYNYIDQVNKDEIGLACSTNGIKRSTYKLLVGKPDGKKDNCEQQDVNGCI
jgi:hypothetical protein